MSWMQNLSIKDGRRQEKRFIEHWTEQFLRLSNGTSL
jgi:hypothetical protein